MAASAPPPDRPAASSHPLYRLVRSAGGVGVAALLSLGSCSDSCFRAGTRVATRRGLIPIERVRVGMSVLSYDLLTGEIVERPVTRFFTHEPRLWGTLGPLSGVTDNHPIFDAGAERFVRADTLTGGELLLHVDGTPIAVGTGGFSYVSEQPEPVYNLRIAGTECYFAEGILVHNKTDCDEPGCGAIPGTGGSGSGGLGTGGRQTGGTSSGGESLQVPPLDCPDGGQGGLSPATCAEENGGVGGAAGAAGFGGTAPKS